MKKQSSIIQYLILGLACLVATPSALAQEGPIKSLRVEEAVKYALDHNKNLEADRQQIAEALGRFRQAGLKANPMIEGSGLTSVNDTGMQNFAVGVSLPLELGRRARRVTLAEREVERMRHEVADRERMLASEIRMKFAESIEIRRNLEFLKQILELNDQSRMLIRARVEEGVSARIEENMQIVELRRVEAQRNGLESKLRVQLEELKGMLGWPADEELGIADEYGEVRLELTREQLLEQALRDRPDLRAAIANEAIGEAMIEMAREEGKLDLSVFGEYGWQRWRFDQMGMTESGQFAPIQMKSSMVKGGVNIMLPVRNRNQGNIEAAAAYRQSARLRREFLESIVRREVAAAYERWTGAARVLQSFDGELIEAQQKNYRIVRASFELGHSRLTDVLAEQRRLVELRMEQTMALKELFLARIDLAKAINGPLTTR